MSQIQNSCNRKSIHIHDLTIQQRQHYQQQRLPADFGIGHSNFFKLDQGLNYIKTYYAPATDLRLISQIENDEPRLVLTLAMKGCSRYTTKKGDSLVFKEGYSTITSFRCSSGERQYQADNELLQLRFSVTKEFLTKYFGNQKSLQLFSANRVDNLSHQPIQPQSMIMVKQMLATNRSSGATRKMLMHGQALSMLASELSPLFDTNTSKKLHFNKHDKEIANTARDILLNEYKNPPSVEQLSKRAGTNQLKLKKLFHHFYHTTPYKLLLEIRMNTAYQLLESSQCHVAIAAELVGYNHASNFSSAFQKFFGVSPKSVISKIL